MAKGVKPRVKVPKTAAAGDTITIKGVDKGTHTAQHAKFK